MPRRLCHDEGVQWLMLSHSLDDGMSSCLVVATLDVELAKEGLEDQRGQQGHPCFQQVDVGGVGAELSEDLAGEPFLEVPCPTISARWQEDLSPSVVHLGEVLRMPIVWRWLGCAA